MTVTMTAAVIHVDKKRKKDGDSSTHQQEQNREDNCFGKDGTARVSIPSLSINPGGDLLLSQDEFRDAFCKYRAIYMPQLLEKNKQTSFSWGDIASLFSSLAESDQESWCIENAAAKKQDQSDEGGIDDKEEDMERGAFLTEDNKKKSRRVGYCSFLVQNDKNALAQTLEDLPLAELPISAKSGAPSSSSSSSSSYVKRILKCKYGPCLWFFFGRNEDTKNGIEGRPEHTDSVCYDGTWHYQLSGTKIWHLRPTEELLNHINGLQSQGKEQQQSAPLSLSSQQHSNDITCSEGDVLLVDTRLWWHRTTIPTQKPLEKKKNGDSLPPYSAVPSVSYARDVYLPRQVGGKGFEEDHESSSKGEQKMIKEDDGTLNSHKRSQNQSDDTNINVQSESATKEKSPIVMTNVDGLYAAHDIEADTIIFKEDEMPECELHRSKDNYNCQVVILDSSEDKESSDEKIDGDEEGINGNDGGGSNEDIEVDSDGVMAVVSIRDIKCGEFFCVPESSSEDEGEGEEEEEVLDDDE